MTVQRTGSAARAGAETETAAAAKRATKESVPGFTADQLHAFDKSLAIDMSDPAKTWQSRHPDHAFNNIRNLSFNHIFRCLNIDFICSSSVEAASIRTC
jgi:hypothetical protein